MPIRWILTKDPAGENKSIAILIIDFRICAKEAIALFVGRWPIETTFQEINQHLGIKTIHTWSDMSINRTAPAIIASYSLACLVVDQAIRETGVDIRPKTSAWYEKSTTNEVSLVRQIILKCLF